MLITPHDRIVFFGDSNTDMGRFRDDPRSLGDGYVAKLAARFRSELHAPQLEVYNRGVSGDRVCHLLERLEPDVLTLQPTVLSILIGVNEIYVNDRGLAPTEPSAFRDQYRTLLRRIRDQLSTQIILLEPFLIPGRPEYSGWRERLNPLIEVVREIAVEFGTELIPLDGIFAEAVTRAPTSHWSGDSIHPTEAGHELIAEEWWNRTLLQAV